MNRATLIRGIQLIVTLTLASFAYVLYSEIHDKQESLAAGLAHVRPGWLLVGAVLALQEGVFGGLRIWVLGRVLWPGLRVRTAVTSEFVLMFCAGVTPGQAGAAPSQAAVLVHGGMRLVDVATAALLTASCTVSFFLLSAVAIFTLRHHGMLVLQGGQQIEWLLLFTVAMFGSGLVALIAAAAYPPLLKAVVRALSVPLGRLLRAVLLGARRVPRLRARAEAALAAPGSTTARLLRSVDEFHQGFRIYMRRGKRAYAAALLLTFAFFCSRFAVAYFILLGLGIPTSPSTFVSVGPPIFQVILTQTLLNFALYMSPTPGASGVAELGSNALMSPWVRGAFVVPYVVLWRVLTLFLCMFVGGIYVFRYLGTDVLEERVKQTEAEKRALEEAARAAEEAARTAEAQDETAGGRRGVG
ncbi:lysylphosphatidylglycerol synthase transmembrane domain-containing protein [Sorangium sp. So ce1182]|uniref:lysylphosphatidylglycerol synthase transmembrane domain-containing protein n=1 Tax=Sorangium sp. So ce1182 TaxID=3133334 RepID=UPI003F5FB7EA